MKLGDLEFTVGDCDAVVMVKEYGSLWTKGQPVITIEHANRILAERLEKAPLVEGYIHSDGCILMDKQGDGSPYNADVTLHTARLVLVEAVASPHAPSANCIEEIKNGSEE